MRKIVKIITLSLLIASLPIALFIFRDQIPFLSKNQLEIPNVLDQYGNPSQPLLDLLSELKVKHDGTLKSIVVATQKEWLREAGKERWEVEEKYPEKKDLLIQFFENFGFVNEINAKQNKYNYALLLGATLSRVRSRLAHLIDQWGKGVRFKKLIFLSGERPLDPKLENAAFLLDTNNKDLPFKKGWKLKGNLPKTETVMMRLVFQQTEIPKEMNAVEVMFIDTPMKKGENGALRRPTTPDTVIEWLKTNPTEGTCLVISNQPYVSYQNSVLKTILPPEFKVETIGKQMDEKSKQISVLFDTLARFLYQEQKQHNKNILKR